MNHPSSPPTAVDRAPLILIPRYTIRQVLLLTAVCGVVFLVMGYGYRGATWAWVVTWGVVALACFLMVQAALFGMIYALFVVFRRRFPKIESESDSVIPGGGAAPVIQDS